MEHDKLYLVLPGIRLRAASLQFSSPLVALNNADSVDASPDTIEQETNSAASAFIALYYPQLYLAYNHIILYLMYEVRRSNDPSRHWRPAWRNLTEVQ